MDAPDIRSGGVEGHALQFASPDRVGHHEFRLIQNAVPGDGRRDEGIAIVGPHRSLDGDALSTILAVLPFIGPRDGRDGGTKAIVVS